MNPDNKSSVPPFIPTDKEASTKKPVALEGIVSPFTTDINDEAIKTFRKIISQSVTSVAPARKK
jgi:hypothetical protein